MTPKELEQYRLKLIRDASSMERKPDRVPHVSFFVTWKILDSGYKLSEAMNNYDIMGKVVREHQEKYGFDAIFEYGGRNAIRIPAALGGTSYVINDEAGTVNYLTKPCARGKIWMLSLRIPTSTSGRRAWPKSTPAGQTAL